jgi:uncharacterized protein (DUF362 family)
VSDDPVAADFTCARLMGFAPYRIPHLAQAAQFLGKGKVQRINQLGEVLPEFAHLIAGATS